MDTQVNHTQDRCENVTASDVLGRSLDGSVMIAPCLRFVFSSSAFNASICSSASSALRLYLVSEADAPGALSADVRAFSLSLPLSFDLGGGLLCFFLGAGSGLIDRRLELVPGYQV